MVKVQDAERVRLITFDRPEARNAFDSELYGATADAISEANVRDDLAVVVLTGEGTAYSAGQDLGEMGRLATAEPTERSEAGAYGFSRFISALETLEKPVVAAVNGVAVGVGLTMLPYCDLVLVSERARFRAPFVNLGVVPEAGSSFTLAAVMGRQAAAHALFTAEWFDAEAAVASGLAWKLCAPGSLVEEALAMARAIATMPIVSLVETKRLLQATRLDSARAARAREEAVFARLITGPANREAIAAFLEKREPNFADLPSE
jgi:enoyl-CoA hydratase/carnithine racemase